MYFITFCLYNYKFYVLNFNLNFSAFFPSFLILFSPLLLQDYLPVDQEELRDYVQARLKVFYEEELDVPLVLFNEVLDHVLRIDRIFKQQQVGVSPWQPRPLLTTPLQGHLLLIGVSGAGKTTLSRFVAWINGLSVFQINVRKC